MRSREEEYNEGYDEGYSNGMLIGTIEGVVMLIRYYRENGDDPLEDHFSDIQKPFVKEAMAVMDKYPNYSSKHLAKKIFFESTYLPPVVLCFGHGEKSDVPGGDE